MSGKVKHPATVAMKVAEKIVEALRPACSRIEIAGSLRRRKEMVGDIEIVYLPKTTQVKNPEALFGDEVMTVNAADLVIQELMDKGSLVKRTNVNGSHMWGEKNKFAVAVKTGIPVDFFAADERNWANLLVCRTGGAKMNTEIAVRANTMGYKWNPYGSGFNRIFKGTGEARYVVIHTEQDVFRFVGLPYMEPHERC